MAKTKRKWIQLDPNHPDALMAHHIYVDATQTITSKLDNHENRITALENAEEPKIKVSSNDTTPAWLQDKIVAGTNITIDVLNDGANEQLRISATAAGTGGGGDPIRWINVSEMVVDDVATGVDAGKAFAIIDTVDFNQAQDGAVWATTQPVTGWDLTQNIALSLLGVFNGTISTDQVVKLQIDVYETPLGGSPTSVLTTTVDANVATDATGKLIETAVGNFTISSASSLITVKVTRLASDAADTFVGTYQLAKIKLTGQFPSGT